MEIPQLTEQERQEILERIRQREIVEKAAVQQEKAAQQQQAELRYRQELAAAAARVEADRRENISQMLNAALNYLQRAIAAFDEKNETETYRLLVRTEEARFSAAQRLTRPVERPSATGVPTIKIAANNSLGYSIINAEDFIEGIHQVYGEVSND